MSTTILTIIAIVVFVVTCFFPGVMIFSYDSQWVRDRTLFEVTSLCDWNSHFSGYRISVYACFLYLSAACNWWGYNRNRSADCV